MVGERSDREGIVQVYYNNTWGWVCANQWDKENADVLCRMMGWKQSKRVVQLDSKSDQVGEPTWMSNFHCVGDENTIFSCPNDGWRKQNCADKRKVNITCDRSRGEKEKSYKIISFLIMEIQLLD